MASAEEEEEEEINHLDGLFKIIIWLLDKQRVANHLSLLETDGGDGGGLVRR